MKGMTKNELDRFEQIIRENEQLKAINAELEAQVKQLIEQLGNEKTE